ncbi:Uncharacterised protein [Kingella potus]|uniref:Uncharacterized protein n=1 Tax=Kingella potus TaxID=265175 RepID=A0A377R2C2_9NEIS|nr:hypothetical protein [Kingella potus]UOP00693.1 hypothetical protein LVJ84_12980 [Kingella potus]STR02907.1 Uncharacterised protein [Kingella potus]
MNQQPQAFQQSTPAIGVGEWIVTLIVLSLPLIGLIMACVWGFSSSTNPSKSNFCKAWLVFALIGIVLYFVLVAAFLGGAAAMQPPQ